MYRVQIVCEGDSIQHDCGYVIYDTTQPGIVPDHIPAEMAQHGWVERDGKHWCPRHDPAMAGEPVEIRSITYMEIAPGVKVRLPDTMFPIKIEVRREGYADVVAAAKALIQQREKDGAVGAYDMADPALIGVLIDYALGLGA